MSGNAYNRAVARETKIWKPFGYSFPFTLHQAADRIIIMGLYASSYLNNHKYLQEVESEELAYLLADYNAKMAELTTQQQIVVADIVGKRYLASVDKLIHDQKMISKQQGIDYDNALMDAKFAALEADRAALTTMSSKIETARINNEAKIAQLQAYIQIEGYNKDAVEIEISEKEIQSAKVDIRKIDAQNDILKIQNETVAADTRLNKAEFEKLEKEIQSGRVDIRKVDTQNDILKIQNETVAADTRLNKAEFEKLEKEIQSGRVDIRKVDTQNDILKIQNETVAAGARLVKMDIEQAEQELKAAKLETKKITEAAEILRIQVETVEAAMQLIDIDLRIASTKVDIAQTQRNIAKLGLLQDDLLIEKAKTAIEQAGIPISEARIRLAQAKYEDAVAEENYMRELLTKEIENYTNRKNLKDAELTAKTQNLEHRQRLQDADNTLKIDLSNLSLLVASDDAASQVMIDNIKVGEIIQKPELAWLRALAAIAAAEKAAAAKITTDLTHTVLKAP